MIEAHCIRCGREIEGKAALIISPPILPNVPDVVEKDHLCRRCHRKVRAKIDKHRRRHVR